MAGKLLFVLPSFSLKLCFPMRPTVGVIVCMKCVSVATNYTSFIYILQVLYCFSMYCACILYVLAHPLVACT